MSKKRKKQDLHSSTLILAIVFFLLLIALIALIFANGLILGQASIQATSTIVRDLPSSVKEGQEFDVTLTYTNLDDEDWLLVDESYSSDFTVVDFGGGSNSTPYHIKWSRTQSPTDEVFTYTLKAPSNTGQKTFSGIFLTQGMSAESSITGDTSIDIVTCDECSSDSCASDTSVNDCEEIDGCNQYTVVPCLNTTPYCYGGVCRQCTDVSHCDDDNSCTTDSCSGYSCSHTNACTDGEYCAINQSCVPCLVTDGNCDGCISTTELGSALTKWKKDEITIIEAGNALDLWKSSGQC